MAEPISLSGDALRRRCDAEKLGFETTADLTLLDDNIGQDRAVEAVRFGVGIRREGYNLFAFGSPGTGKSTLVKRYVEENARRAPVPDEWVYVNNFAEPHKPRALRLPAGRSVQLRTDMEQLVEDLQAAISSAFESDDYQARRQAIEQEQSERHEKAFGDLQARANARETALIRTPVGFAFAPTHAGEVVRPDQFRRWPKERQARVKKAVSELEVELQKLLKQMPQSQRELREKIDGLNKEVTEFAVGHLMDRLRTRYAGLDQVLGFLNEVEKNVIENARDFISTGSGDDGAEGSPTLSLRSALSGPPSFRRYQANVIVDHGEDESAPIVYEDHPTHPNLVGRIEHLAQFGALMTDFNLIKPGALHRANGGYLILDARRLLMQPYAWEELKRAIRSKEIRIAGIAEALGMASTVTLEPEPIPLDVKVILLGDRSIHHLLSALDPDFSSLFKVPIDFDDRLDRTAENDILFSRLIATMIDQEALKPFDAGAVARIIDHASRLADDSEKLSLRLRLILDLLREADYWAEDLGEPLVTAAHVQRAIDARLRRLSRLRERDQEEIKRGMILISTEGETCGQVNGLSVLRIGDFWFGRPSRITARIRLGRGEVVDIEREVTLGGPIHSKGVLILSGFLGERFGRELPLAISASIVFEQSYGGVEGDSASSAELYALLSAISRIPLKQSYAVTGSVNQHGEVQPIGGVNEKVEGFFDICRARGLTGEQGVLIPQANIKHLMLREDVVEAVDAGRFHVYPISSIDQGIELLTGVRAGERDIDGRYPEGTVNQAVQDELEAFAERARSFAFRTDEGAKP